jgi:hypothetical protein
MRGEEPEHSTAYGMEKTDRSVLAQMRGRRAEAGWHPASDTAFYGICAPNVKQWCLAARVSAGKRGRAGRTRRPGGVGDLRLKQARLIILPLGGLQKRPLPEFKVSVHFRSPKFASIRRPDFLLEGSSSISLLRSDSLVAIVLVQGLMA